MAGILVVHDGRASGKFCRTADADGRHRGPGDGSLISALDGCTSAVWGSDAAIMLSTGLASCGPSPSRVTADPSALIAPSVAALCGASAAGTVSFATGLSTMAGGGAMATPIGASPAITT